MTSLVRSIAAAPSAIALMHFANRLSFETDCSDVYSSQQAGELDFVLLDVRSPEAFARGHVPGARCSWCIAPARTVTARTRRR